MKPAALGNAIRILFSALGLSFVGCSGAEDKGPALTPVATCTESFTACGGDEVGTWLMTSLCSTTPIKDLLNLALATDYPACGQSFTDASTSISAGSAVKYDGTRYTRTGSMQTTGKMKLTPACVAAQVVGLPLTANSCSNLALVLPAMYPGTKFSCTFDDTNCNCDTSSVDSLDASGTYTKSGSAIVESSGQMNYSYCVSGNQLAQQGILASTTTGAIALQAIAHLTKQ
jgi:hypothetical protein